MRRSRSTQGQVVGVLGEHEAGVATAVLCRQYGVSEQTFYRWKRKYGGLERGEATWLQTLEEENARLMRLVAEKALDNLVLKDFLRKNASRPPSGGQRSRRCGSASLVPTTAGGLDALLSPSCGGRGHRVDRHRTG